MRPLASHMLLTTLAAAHRLSQSFGPTSCRKCIEAKHNRSGIESSMAWKPAAEMASSFLGRVCSSLQPMEQLA